MNFPNYEALKKMLDIDIEEIQKSENLSDAERLVLFKQIVTAYVGVIPNLYDGLYGQWTPNGHEGINYRILQTAPDEVKENLQFLLRKLKIAKAGFGIITVTEETEMINNKIVIQNNITSSISYESACSAVKDITGLTDEQVKDAISKIREIEEATLHSKNDKTRWEKIRPILAWLGNSSFELAKVILPLLLSNTTNN